MNSPIIVTLLAGNTFRARAYAQQLAKIKHEQIVVKGFFYGFKQKPISEVFIDDITKNYLTKEDLLIPDLNENIKTTFEQNNWNYVEYYDENVNESNLILELNKINTDIIVFCGYGGQLLRSGHFQSCKKYLHMHPGILPSERGSTTLYYSILSNRSLGVTAFYMTEEIDEGKIVLTEEYPSPLKGVNIDVWLDNIIRADCFSKALMAILQDKKNKALEGDSNEYYVIHPVLKHIALLSLKE